MQLRTFTYPMTFTDAVRKLLQDVVDIAEQWRRSKHQLVELSDVDYRNYDLYESHHFRIRIRSQDRTNLKILLASPLMESCRCL